MFCFPYWLLTTGYLIAKGVAYMAGRAGFGTGSRMTRRDCVRIGAIGLGGLTLPGLLRANALADGPKMAPKAKSVIVLFLSGGPSQLDMWDMKPDAPEEIRGTFRPIEAYPFDERRKTRSVEQSVVELVVLRGVPDIASHLIAAHRVHNGSKTELWRRPGAAGADDA